MSSENSTIITNSLFISRLVELLGTNKPAEIGRKLEIDYQSAKNYLSGRKPNAEVLERIVEKTDVSLNWLLLGHGPKYIKDEAFDLERSIERHDDWTDVLRDWYDFEGNIMPNTQGASFMGGWKSFDKRQKIDAIRDFKKFLDMIKDE